MLHKQNLKFGSLVVHNRIVTLRIVKKSCTLTDCKALRLQNPQTNATKYHKLEFHRENRTHRAASGRDTSPLQHQVFRPDASDFPGGIRAIDIHNILCKYRSQYRVPSDATLCCIFTCLATCILPGPQIDNNFRDLPKETTKI